MARIEVLEGLSMPGSLDRDNEDALGATHWVAFALDGVTGVGDAPLMPGKSDAMWVSHAARDLLIEHGTEEAARNLKGLIAKVATGINERFVKGRSRAPNARYEQPYTTLSMIGVEPGKIHIASLGDSRVLIETSDDQIHNFGPKSRSTFEQKTAARMLAARKGQALGTDTIRATVLDDLRRAREIVNTPQGYWLLGADPAAGANAIVKTIPLDGPAVALIMTDGFYALVEDYRHYGDRELIANAQTLGLHILGRELRHVEDDDPVGERYPRMKKSDDATALLVRIEP
jgi:hypothetical protein